MRPFAVVLVLVASVCLAGDGQPVIPVTAHAQAEAAVFKAGRPLLMSVTLANGLPQTIRFPTFATEPNDWNGEATNISLVDVYRNGQKRNLYLARPEASVPRDISGPGSHPVKPGEALRVVVDMSRWKIEGGWTKGEYELVFRMDKIAVDEKVTLSVLADPVRVVVQ